jgi:hypothetical protein
LPTLPEFLRFIGRASGFGVLLWLVFSRALSSCERNFALEHQQSGLGSILVPYGWLLAVIVAIPAACCAVVWERSADTDPRDSRGNYDGPGSCEDGGDGDGG